MMILFCQTKLLNMKTYSCFLIREDTSWADFLLERGVAIVCAGETSGSSVLRADQKNTFKQKSEHKSNHIFKKICIFKTKKCEQSQK